MNGIHISKIFNDISQYTSTTNRFWGPNCLRLAEAIHNTNSLAELVDYASKEFDFSIDGIAYKYPKEVPFAIDWLLGLYPNIDISPKPTSITEELIIHQDLTPNCLQTNIMRHRLNSYINLSKVNKVLEIGAGYGALAREILLCNNNTKYIIVDLPVSLCFSIAFLKLEFPNKNHIYVTNAEQLALAEDFDIIYIPAGLSNDMKHHEQFHDIDLCINTCSFGEMNDEICNEYYHLITTELGIKYYYWLNRFMNVYTGSRHGEIGCAINFPKAIDIQEFEFMPDFLLCPYLLDRHARMAEIFGILQEHKYRKDILIQEIGNSAFFNRNMTAPYLIDRSKHGVLFKTYQLYRIFGEFTYLLKILNTYGSNLEEKEATHFAHPEET